MTVSNSITATLVWYYAICPRECWLMAHQIEPERDDDFLALGRLNTETHYKRETKEVGLPGGVRVDQIRHENGSLILCEVKKTSKFLPAARLQLAYYLWLLEKEGVVATGEILVPEERLREALKLEDLRERLQTALDDISSLIHNKIPPKANWIRYCRTCAYAEFCWSGGDEI